jgi:hypothetical protein
VWLLVLTGSLAIACGAEPPAGGDWDAAWRHARDEVVDPATFRDSDRRDQCERTLGALRRARHALQPAPDETLAEGVDAWLSFAEHMMYECPVRSGRYAGFEAGFVHLRRLAAVVDASRAQPELREPAAR